MRTKQNTPLADRLLSRRTIDANGCWLWTGAIDKYGYGKMKYRGALLKVHRASLHVFKGMPLDDPQFGLHSCDVRHCFNPDHLTPGTPTENSAHIWERKRYTVGRATNGQFTPPADNSDLPF